MEQIDLEGIIYPEFTGGLDLTEQMKRAADKGEPLLLIDGVGGVWGRCYAYRCCWHNCQ